MLSLSVYGLGMCMKAKIKAIDRDFLNTLHIKCYSVLSFCLHVVDLICRRTDTANIMIRISTSLSSDL